MKARDAQIIAAIVHQAVSPAGVSLHTSMDWAEAIVDDLEEHGWVDYPATMGMVEATYEPTADKEQNPIGYLQEICQKAGSQAPQYNVTEMVGMGTAYKGQVSCFLEGELLHAEGETKGAKRDAKRSAARAMIELLEGDDDEK